MNRRAFIGNAVGLAALASFPAIASESDVARFERMVKKGLVEDETFRLDRSVIIDVSDLRINRCRFVATAPTKRIEITGKRTVIENSCFQGVSVQYTSSETESIFGLSPFKREIKG